MTRRLHHITFSFPTKVFFSSLSELTQKTKLKMKRAYLTHNSQLLRAVIPAVFACCLWICGESGSVISRSLSRLQVLARLGPVPGELARCQLVGADRQSARSTDTAARCPRARSAGRIQRWWTTTPTKKDFFLSFFQFHIFPLPHVQHRINYESCTK